MKLPSLFSMCSIKVPYILVFIAFVFLAACSQQEQKQAKADAKGAARHIAGSTKDLTTAIGHSARDISRETGHFFRDIFSTDSVKEEDK